MHTCGKGVYGTGPKVLGSCSEENCPECLQELEAEEEEEREAQEQSEAEALEFVENPDLINDALRGLRRIVNRARRDH